MKIETIKVSGKDNYFAVAWRLVEGNPWIVIGGTAIRKGRISSDEMIDNEADQIVADRKGEAIICLLYTSPSPRDRS